MCLMHELEDGDAQYRNDERVWEELLSLEAKTHFSRSRWMMCTRRLDDAGEDAATWRSRVEIWRSRMRLLQGRPGALEVRSAGKRAP